LQTQHPFVLNWSLKTLYKALRVRNLNRIMGATFDKLVQRSSFV